MAWLPPPHGVWLHQRVRCGYLLRDCHIHRVYIGPKFERSRWTSKQEHHWSLHVPDGRGRHTNRSARLTFMFAHCLRQDLITRIRLHTNDFRGRHAAARMVSETLDITAVNMYFPPPSAEGARGLREWRAAVRSMCLWLDQLLLELPQRTLPQHRSQR